MSPTRKEPTVHGDVEYSTRDCDNCGHETVTSELHDVYLGSTKSTKSRSNYYRVKFNSRPEKYRFCPTCLEEEGDTQSGLVAEALRQSRQSAVPEWLKVAFMSAMFLLFMVIMTAVMYGP